MYLTTQECSELSRVFQTQGVSARAAGVILSTLSHWEKHKGIEYVVKTLKTLRHEVASGEFTQTTWPSSLEHLRKLALKSRRLETRIHKLLAIYGRWTASEPTDEDWEVYHATITPRRTDHGVRLEPSKETSYLARLASSRARFSRSLPNSDDKTVPLFHSLKESQVDLVHHLEIAADDYPSLLHSFPRVFSHIVELDMDSFFEHYVNPFWAEECEYEVVGKISCLTSDRGLKRRYIANPSRLVQLALTRLQSACDLLLQDYPESAVHCQEKGPNWAQAQLRKGKLLWSMDLSSATDHFPLDLQVDLLQKIFPDLSEDISLWEKVCRSKWDTPIGKVTFTQGQPMGTAPSFAAFTLTHIELIRSLGGDASNFRVIGDDVVISCPDLAENYASTMARLGVTVNLSKSILGKPRCEFAGRIIDAHGVWPSFKAAPLSAKADPLGYLRQYGLAAADLIPHGIRKEAVAVAKCSNHWSMKHMQDEKFIKNLSYMALEELYKVNIEPFSSGPMTAARQTRFSTLTSRLEADGHLKVVSSLSRGNKNPRLVTEHVNACQREGGLNDHLMALASSLSLAGANRSAWDDKVQKLPISFVKKLGRALLTPEQES